MVITVGAVDFHSACLLFIKPLNLRVQLHIGSKFAASDVGDYRAADGIANLYFGNILRACPVSSFGEYIRLEQFQRLTDCLVVVHGGNTLIHTSNALEDRLSIPERSEHEPLFPEQEIVAIQYND